MQYTDNLNTILLAAGHEAGRMTASWVEPEHLVLAILNQPQSTAYSLLQRAGVDMEALRQELEKDAFSITTDVVPLFSRTTERMLRVTVIEAENYGATAAGSAHLLLSILRERINRPAAWLETNASVTYETIEQLLKPTQRPTDNQPKEEDDEPLSGDGSFLSQFFLEDMIDRPKRHKKGEGTPTLEKYAVDLTLKARNNELDPIIGREEEIRRVQEILLRHKKNNPILIGEPGVGKSAIVEGLALYWGRGAVVQNRLLSLNMANIVAGTTYRGQFEQRIQNIVEELREHPEIVLFIDEIHTIVGAGNAHGGLDAANILKPALARGEIRCIGATTIEEYRKSIENDGALERRFQPVMVRPSTPKETLTILRRLAPKYEEYHNTRYSDEALEACVRLTERYISNRSLPDKAIDAMDEAGAVRHYINSYYMHVITPDDVAKVVSRMSGVPVQRMLTKESDQLLHLDEHLRQRVIGQDNAIDRLVRAIRRSRIGLRDPNRPIGSFFFLGSTGVGKTYLAQCLAEEMFGSRDAIIRFDMSEYAEKHSVSLLVGAPPGYVAHEDGGKLTEAVRRRPYSIVLFDEIEKAHPDIFNVLLQVLDEGRLTDRHGHSVDFRNTIIILTSNVGTRQLRDFGAGVGFEANEITSERATQVLKKALDKTFPPEFVNRIDDIISFDPLSRETIAQIVDIELDKVRYRLRETGKKLTISDATREKVLLHSYDSANGARPIRRSIQEYVEDPVTERIIHKPEIKTIKI